MKKCGNCKKWAARRERGVWDQQGAPGLCSAIVPMWADYAFCPRESDRIMYAEQNADPCEMYEAAEGGE